MGWFRERMARIHTLDVVNSLTLEGVPMTPPGYPGAGYKGKRYFVNNIQGDSGNAGKSWNNAMDELSTAISAWETYRALLTTDDQYIRGQIFVQGTATAYSAITTLPSHCDIIGIGADPRGHGTGIARIGADTGDSDGVDATTTARGVNFYNLQFQAGRAGYAFRGTNLFRCRWENCVFATNGDPEGGTGPAAGFSAAICSGNVWKDCHWINASGKGVTNDVGFQITSTHFHNCLVENCHITGADVGIEIDSTCVFGYGSIFKDCYVGDGSETCTLGVDDNATEGHIIFAGLYVLATTEFSLANNGADRIMGCIAKNAYLT